jgi:hypothetical protein
VVLDTNVFVSGPAYPGSDDSRNGSQADWQRPAGLSTPPPNSCSFSIDAPDFHYEDQAALLNTECTSPRLCFQNFVIAIPS